jgi:hypothetical protein
MGEEGIWREGGGGEGDGEGVVLIWGSRSSEGERVWERLEARAASTNMEGSR